MTHLERFLLLPGWQTKEMSTRLKILKGTVSVISSGPPCKDDNSLIYSYKLCLIKKELDIDVLVSLNYYFTLQFLCKDLKGSDMNPCSDKGLKGIDMNP